jgi:hypothetical protein
MGDYRADAAALYPGFPAGVSCGFSGEVNVGDLPDGMHEATIRISALDGAMAELTTTFEVDNHAFETGRVIGRLDQPHRGAEYIPRETIIVSGWALAPSGIKRIDAFVDGETRGRIDHRGLRPDIAKRRRQYADADHCGFSGMVPSSGWTKGATTARSCHGKRRPPARNVNAHRGRGRRTVDGGIPVINRQYRGWLEKRAARLDRMASDSADYDSRLSFGVIVALEGDCEDALEAVVSSMQAQTYPDWDLELVDSGNASDASRAYAQQLARVEQRVSYREPRGGVVDALNAALAGSESDWVAIPASRHHPRSCCSRNYIRAAGANPDAALTYTDDDRIDPESMERWNPFFKPDWSPDLLTSMNYLKPLILFHRQTALAVGGLRKGFPGAEVYDLALRMTERSSQVHHVPEILVTSIATAPDFGEPWHVSYWQESERQALKDALARRGFDGEVERGIHPGTWRIRYALPDPVPAVTAVIRLVGSWTCCVLA